MRCARRVAFFVVEIGVDCDGGPALQDAMIAATAKEHGYAVVTRNTADLTAVEFSCRIPG